ncbi:single-stranded-DNA-specific exonuclease RecJ [Candidatus Xianfuyuplasma coldseepsis]|uniref:Single-stranded-DNA-specific exonuclease RecJ n=1 Tax=Candidatus Xianfuyuplasma coldseepsis TaxID=2782163 RepID=A0A7L7KV73_9MOLU|nr:single-stranded-DNA-specific exonuclease RecJ [Xianfuyuplasma coldseepsis]QMS85894.1 single-stranded-DNA-specific exonuclease RecJ [Xianfuyuplasma coldseepsis]
MFTWKIKNKDLDQNNLVRDIYRARGVDNYQALFQLDERSFHDPYLLKDMQKSVDRIMHAIENKQSILVYGDYDVDGITSTFLIYRVLQELGAKIDYDIPNRFVDGYGLSYSKTFDIVNEGYDLVITVDNGIKSIEEVKILTENNIDVIVTDHHESEAELPNAFSILHTQLCEYPFKPLAGVGVAFKLAQALIGEEALEYIDIVALGTIADMMPLVEENRAFVNVGLQKLAHSSNEGLRNLLAFLDITTPSVADVQYKIAPRINACGRMKSAKLAVHLLEATNTQEALRYITEIEETNNRRKKLTQVLYQESVLKLNHTEPSIIVHSPRMHEGVLGIVASRLANEFSKVSVVLKEDEFTYRGSIRSYSGIDVIYVLDQLKDLLIRYGGHQNAAGLEFKKELLDEFKDRFNEQIPTAHRDDSTVAEGYIDIQTLDINQITELERYDLKDAVFVFKDIYPDNRYLIKGEHTKLIIGHDSEAIFFNNKTLYNKLNKTNPVTLLGRLDVNYFRGRYKKQIIIDDYYTKN